MAPSKKERLAPKGQNSLEEISRASRGVAPSGNAAPTILHREF
jgi:hypothetical protein